MITLNFTEAAIEPSEKGFYFKALIPNSEVQQARQFVLTKRDKPHVLEIKEKKEKRSLDANAYFWKLLTELANALGTTKEELYLKYVREVGPYKDFTFPPDDAKTFRTAWSMLGTGWPTEQVDYTPDGEQVIIRAYYGSSQYSKKQMSRLIDSVVTDCQAIGIETLTPDKLSLLKEEWNAQRN